MLLNGFRKSDKLQVKLTSASSTIGRQLLNKFRKTDSHFWEQIHLGDFFLEGFFKCNYINIYREGSGKRSPYIIIPKEILKPEKFESSGISYTKISKIKNLFQNDSFPLIKHWTFSDKNKFLRYINEPFIKAANKLQQTPWIIDNDILAIVKNNPNKFFNTDKFKVDIFGSNWSKWYAYNAITNLADKYKGSKFYNYISLDYRGRIYYVEPYLSYQGQDLARGILKFHNKRLLTERGINALAIHTANSFNANYTIDNLPNWLTTDYKPYLEKEGVMDISVDKMTLQDRYLWTENNLDLIRDTWMDKVIHDCEKPVVFLACCKEIYMMNEYDEYYSNLPIPIDGSNNGWQHLAAISKDEKAGKLVGLVPTKVPRDFYLQTAKVLKDSMPEWFDERDMPMKDIRKGISKRGSMTRAYSAGKLAIALNMAADCEKEGFHEKYNISESDYNKLSGNLIKAINEVCPGPLRTMSFLQKLAFHIIKTQNTIEWITPSGFPVIYEKYCEKDIKVRSVINGIGQINHVGKDHIIIDGKKVPSPGGYAAGISPNFIHSMDAAHMALIIEKWDDDFAAIHDSFSVHADRIDELKDLTKETFIEIYKNPDYYMEIRDMLCKEFDIPDEFFIGDLEVEDIRESDYFFS